MSLSLETMLQLSIILPLLATLGIVATGHKPNLREGVTIVTSLVLLYLVINLYLGLKQGASISVHWWELLPGLNIILVAAHKSKISEMRGLGRQMPITMAAFFIASLSIIGVPPTGGTWSKWYLLMGTIETEQFILMGILMVSSLLNIAYLLPIPFHAFFSADKTSASSVGIKEAPLPSLIALCVTTAGCVILFVYPQPLYELAKAILAT